MQDFFTDFPTLVPNQYAFVKFLTMYYLNYISLAEIETTYPVKDVDW